DGLGDGLQLGVRSREIRKYLHAGLRRSRGAPLEKLAIAIDEPREQDVNGVCIDRAAASREVRTPSDRALLDLEMTVVGDRLGDVEQQEIVQKDTRVGGKCFRRPIGRAVEQIPCDEAA